MPMVIVILIDNGYSSIGAIINIINMENRKFCVLTSLPV